MAKKTLIRDGETAPRDSRRGVKKKVGVKRGPKMAAGPTHATLNIRRVPIDDIDFAPYNPRRELKPGEPEYNKLRDSLLSFGYAESITWNERSGNLVGGHQRLRILIREQKITHVDAVVVDLDPSRERALNLALNKISGAWDEQKLAEVLAELEQDPNIDETLTGFDADEIDKIIEESMAAAGEGPEPATQADPGSAIGNTYAVIVHCVSEAEQRKLFDRMQTEGHQKVRLSTL